MASFEVHVLKNYFSAQVQLATDVHPVFAASASLLLRPVYSTVADNPAPVQVQV